MSRRYLSIDKDVIIRPAFASDFSGGTRSFITRHRRRRKSSVESLGAESRPTRPSCQKEVEVEVEEEKK